MKLIHSLILFSLSLIFCGASPLYVREITINEVRIGQKVRIIEINGSENKFKIERISKEKIFGAKASVKKENIQKIEIMVGGEEDFGILEPAANIGLEVQAIHDLYDAVQ